MTKAPERILLVRPSALGDVCRTVPLLASLRLAFPTAQIDWVVQEEYVPVVEAHPALNHIVGFPRAELSKWWRSPRGALRLMEWLGSLRKARYDLVVDAQGLFRSGIMTAATMAPIRVGYADAREGAWLAYSHRRALSQGRHAVEAMLGLLECIGIERVADMKLYCAADDLAEWAACREELGLAENYVVLAPGSKWSSKRWPADGWTQLSQQLLSRGFDLAVVGSPAELQLCRSIAEGAGNSRIFALAGRLGVGATMAAIRQASLVIANDSAPLHMAVGFSRPLVGLFGPTDPAIVGPYGCERWVIQHPVAAAKRADYKDSALGDSLMRHISVDMVLDRATEALAATTEAAEIRV